MATRFYPTYILQKDLPNLKAGAKFKYIESLNRYTCLKTDHSEPVEYWPERMLNNPEWFLPEGENGLKKWTDNDMLEMAKAAIKWVEVDAKYLQEAAMNCWIDFKNKKAE